MNKHRVLNDEYGIASMQNVLLDALDILDSICRSHGIQYSLHGGTLLGAERDHHMIPWDDDIDISMRRDEFERLRTVLNKETSDVYYLDERTLWIPRFIIKNTDPPVFIDILIWDFISEKRIEQKLKILVLRALQGMLKETIDYSAYNLIGKVLVGVTHYLGKLFTNKRKHAFFHYAATKLLTGNKEYIHRSNDSYRGCSYIMDKDYMNDYTELELEGSQYMVNPRYHEFLIMEYGPDYLIPPPENKRVLSSGHKAIRKSISSKQK